MGLQQLSEAGATSSSACLDLPDADSSVWSERADVPA